MDCGHVLPWSVGPYELLADDSYANLIVISFVFAVVSCDDRKHLVKNTNIGQQLILT